MEDNNYTINIKNLTEDERIKIMKFVKENAKSYVMEVQYQESAESSPTYLKEN